MAVAEDLLDRSGVWKKQLTVTPVLAVSSSMGGFFPPPLPFAARRRDSIARKQGHFQLQARSSQGCYKYMQSTCGGDSRFNNDGKLGTSYQARMGLPPSLSEKSRKPFCLVPLEVQNHPCFSTTVKILYHIPTGSILWGGALDLCSLLGIRLHAAFLNSSCSWPFGFQRDIMGLKKTEQKHRCL